MIEKETFKEMVREIVEILRTEKELSNFKLLKICKVKDLQKITREGDFHLPHELVEVAVNQYILENYHQKSSQKTWDDFTILTDLKNLEKRLPVQSWRSEQQQLFQQFSTPPTIAYLMAKIINPIPTDSILEPSAGTGSLVTWLRMSDCKVYMNEISERRRLLLEFQGYIPTAYNAEFLNDVLPENIQPNGILMNPPFSSSGGRTKKNDSNFGFRHIKSALFRLKSRGKLVALVGTESGTKTNKARSFWSQIANDYEIKAFIHLPQNAYYKYGTSIATSIVCLSKDKTIGRLGRIKNGKNQLEINCKTLEDCLIYSNIFDN